MCTWKWAQQGSRESKERSSVEGRARSSIEVLPPLLAFEPRERRGHFSDILDSPQHPCQGPVQGLEGEGETSEGCVLND